MLKSAFIMVLLILSVCVKGQKDTLYFGFWEGPHPEDPNKKFYIQIENLKNSLFSQGYWTENSFYQSKFNVDSVSINQDKISFYVPGWHCTYKGQINKDLITGGFDCAGEPFDSVQLIKNISIENHLIYPKPGCKNTNYSYRYKNLGTGIESFKDSMFIENLVNEILDKKYGRINSFLVSKNNKLICEEFFFGYTENDLHQIESCSKSVTSILIGIATDKGFIKNLNEPVCEIFPEYAHLKTGNYKAITVKNLLTMQSGFEPQNDQLFRAENKFDFAINRKLNSKPGTKFQYDGGNTEILGAVLYRKTGTPVDDFAREFLFQPLAIMQFTWEGDHQLPLMAGSLRLKPEDLLKLGELILNKGKFNDRQIVSEKWIKESTTVKTKTHIPGDDYSFQWWNLNLVSNGKTYPVIWANGWGSQFIYIIPEIEVVIVTTGHNYEYDSWAITEGIEKYLYLLDPKYVVNN